MQSIDGVDCKKVAPILPYEEGFATDSGEFIFMDEVDLSFSDEEGIFLLTPKAAKSLNSQFHRSQGVYVHPECGFFVGEEVIIRSKTGSLRLEVHHDDRLRHDCALIYAGTPGVNRLTPDLLSYDGENAVYQENKIKVEKC